MAGEARIVSRSSELNRRWSRIWRWSLVASVGFHLLMLILFRTEIFLPVIETSAAGPDAGDTRAAAGGGMEAIAMQIQQPPPAPQPEPVVVPPVPTPTPTITPIPDPPVDTVRPVTPPSQTTGTGTGQTQQQAGGGTGSAAGPGTATGTGRGGGGDSETGAGRIIAPSPRGLILPPSDRPRSVRGKSITVYVFVNERGTVVSDSTRLDPSSGDGGFDRRLKQQASEWRFRAGSRGGSPIATWVQYVLTF
jgi:outer membrane biosynthesis protein TonB